MHACLLGDWLAADARQPHVERRRISEWKREPWWEHHVGARLQCQTLGMCGWQRARQIRNGPMDGWMDPLRATARRRLDHNAHARWVEGFTFSTRRFFSEFIENEIRTEFRWNSSKTDRVATLNSKKRNSHFSTEFRWFLGEIRWFLTEKHIYPMEKKKIWHDFETYNAIYILTFYNKIHMNCIDTPSFHNNRNLKSTGGLYNTNSIVSFTTIQVYRELFNTMCCALRLTTNML